MKLLNLLGIKKVWELEIKGEPSPKNEGWNYPVTPISYHWKWLFIRISKDIKIDNGCSN